MTLSLRLTNPPNPHGGDTGTYVNRVRVHMGKKGTPEGEEVGGPAGVLWHICDMSRDIEKFDCPPI